MSPGELRIAAAAGVNGVCDDVSMRVSRRFSPPRLMLAGQIDYVTLPALAAGLTLAFDGATEIHLDLGGVEFCDLAGLRAIVSLTGGSRGQHPARRVVLHRLPPRLREVLRILGWDATPGLVLAAGSSSFGSILHWLKPGR